PISVVNCVADAGTITADFVNVSLVNGSANLSATPDGNINVPAGYSVIYVLTKGGNLVIEQVSTTPDFTVTVDGDYTIHTLVYNADSNSSDFLDLSVVQFGTTTGVDVLNLVTANGICASLDVAGAGIHVAPCTADAGTITADFSQVSLVGGSASLSATPDGNINVPTGYSVIYVLTSGSGLVIEQVNTTPDFTVSATGDYTIHTLVYNGDNTSSDFLDLSVVQFGTTTG
ncbi:MAG: T9SS C-terminal target domain-containing protein, partial [Bacteroidota bacterium]